MKGMIQKNFLVTGAASGIGASITKFLTERGHFVFACDIQECKNSENLKYLYLDVTNLENIKKAIQEVLLSEKQLSGVVNCAGIVKAGPLMELDLQEVQDIFGVNAFGMFEVTKACFPLLLKTKGRIVNISSLSGKIAFPFMGPYAMSKYTVEAFSDSLRRELQPLGIKVSIIEPGKIRTPLLTKAKQIALQKSTQVSEIFRERGMKFAAFDEQRAEQNAIPPEIVAKKVYHALFSRKPKRRYLIVKNMIKTKILLHLPAKVLDRVIQGKIH